MSDQPSNQPNNQIIPLDISALSFDSFGRDARRDVVCLAPIRTVIRREEEIVLVRKVRKVEEIDAGPSCPVTSETLSSNPFSGYQPGSRSTSQPVAEYQAQPSVAEYQAQPQQPVYAGQTYSSPSQPSEAQVYSSQPQTYRSSGYPSQPLTSTVEEELIVHSQRNCLYIDQTSMDRLQNQISVSRVLQPGIYTIRLKSGTFDYRVESGHVGEPLVLLWLYGGRVVNQQTGVEVGATWSSLNGYGDALTIDVREATSLCAFFFDTFLEDNEGDVTVTIEGSGYAEDLIVNSQRNCYFIDPDTMRTLEQETSVSKTLQPGAYAIKIKSGAFDYRSYSGFQGEPLVLLWIYGGRIVNRQTGVEVGATWVSLNGYDDTLILDVREATTICAFFFDTHLEDNEGQVTLSVKKI